MDEFQTLDLKIVTYAPWHYTCNEYVRFDYDDDSNDISTKWSFYCLNGCALCTASSIQLYG